MTLSSDQLLQICRTIAGLDTTDQLCSIERFDGFDVDAVIRQRMRHWYLRLLSSSIPGLNPPVSDATALTTLTRLNDSPVARVNTDDSVCNLLSLQLNDWHTPVPVMSEAQAAPRIPLLANPFSSPGKNNPLLWRAADGQIYAAPVSESSEVYDARGIIDPGPDTYILPPAALAAIPNFLNP